MLLLQGSTCMGVDLIRVAPWLPPGRLSSSPLRLLASGRGGECDGVAIERLHRVEIRGPNPWFRGGPHQVQS